MYEEAKTITLEDDDPVELSTLNYPGRTHADCKWILINKFAGSFLLTFVDFNITFGASLTIGFGADFEQESQVLKLGTPDIPIDVNDTMLLTTSTVWIWFQTNDPMARLNDRLYYAFDYIALRYKQYPSVSGVKLQMSSADFNKGLYCVKAGHTPNGRQGRKD